MSERYYGVSYYPIHIYKILRADKLKGGGSKVSAKEFDNEILGMIFTRALMEYSELLPSNKISKALVSVDKKLPDELIGVSWKIKRFLDEHGPFSPLAIGLMTCIIGMDRVGINDYHTYFALLEYLDNNPATDFKDYINKLTEFEKGLKNE